jgi:hypothetical protein
MHTNTQPPATQKTGTSQAPANTTTPRRDDDQFSNDWWREFAETWK